MSDGFVHRTYACVYDVTPDEMPILDRAVSVGGLYFALGFSGGGFSLSPWVGRAMAEFIFEQKTPPQIERFDLNRFAEGRTFNWSNVDTASHDE
jgi:sarcosine oxidase subunit beta